MLLNTLGSSSRMSSFYNVSFLFSLFFSDYLQVVGSFIYIPRIISCWY